jgi:NAD-dependent DNA ligase
MPTEKLTRILLSKSPFSQEQIAAMTDAEGWKWVYTNKAPVKKKNLEVCFTGFSDSEKGVLCQLATDSGLMVVTTVTRHLFCLCAGANPGPVKLAKAAKQGVPVWSLDQFNLFLKTGELPT